MDRIAELRSILLVHAEDPALLREPKGPTPRDFLNSRPAEAEVAAIATAIGMARETGCRLHVVHVSTARCADLIEEAVRRGVDGNGGTCPPYLLFTRNDPGPPGGVGKWAPPIPTGGERP